MHLIRNTFLFLAALGLWGCDSCKGKQPAPNKGGPEASPSASESATIAPPAPPIRQLAERTAPDVKVLSAARAAELKALDGARLAQGAEDAKKALATLAAVRDSDLTGGYLALETSRTALRAGEVDQAIAAAQQAARYAAGNPKLMKAATDALGAAVKKKGAADGPRAPEPGAVSVQSAAAMSPVASFSAACEAIVKSIRAGGVALHSSAGGAELPVTCEQDYALQLGASELRRAVGLKVDVAPKSPAGAMERLVWVGLETAQGVVPWGPVAHVVAPAGAVSDVVVDLQHVDVLPGKSPELVVKVMERRTEPDIALNEVTKTDRTWVVLLTLDRGKLEASKPFVLESRVVRDALDPAEKKYPAAAPRAAALGKVEDYAMKVAWTGVNSITLTKASGNATPFAEGEIRLFTE